VHFVFVFPSKKFFLQKSSASEFLNLPHAREARGTPYPHWFSVAHATENQSNSDPVSSMVSIYNSARTYFTLNHTP
jgi:hypothetical protein